MKDIRKILEIISEETRYEIINLLSSSSRFLTVTEISEKLSKDKKTIDKHLRILLEYELVERKYLEDERAYGYSLTKFCYNLLSSIEKAVSLQERLEVKEEKSLKIVSKFNWNNILVPLILVSLAFIVGYGHLLGLFGENFLIIPRLLLFLTFIFLALFYLYYKIKLMKSG